MKSLFVVFSLLMICILGAAPAVAVEHSKFAIGGEVSGYTGIELTEFIDERSTREPKVKMRFRLFLGSKGGLDLGIGFWSLSGIDYDSATGTEMKPGSMCLSIEGGGFIKAVEGNKSYFGLIGRFGLTIHKWYDYNFFEKDYEDYTVFAPNIYFGIEQTYFFTKRFSMFATIGLRIKFIPDSKLISYTAGPFLTDWYWRKQEDSRIFAKFDGIIIGFMYFL